MHRRENMNSYTLYWTNNTWDQYKSEQSKPLLYVAGDSLSKIKKGDEIFVVTAKDHRLFIGGRLISSGVAVDRDRAIQLLDDENIIDKKQYVIADVNQRDYFRSNLSLDAGTVKRIEKIDVNGIVKQCEFSQTSFMQDFRAMSKISEKSAKDLRQLLKLELKDLDEADDVDIRTNPADDNPEKRVLRELLARRGQPRFRNNLLEAYDATCCVTKSKVVELLEAAHIDPHSDGGDYTLENGLLLRSDIHTLFDQYLLAFDEYQRLILSKKLRNSEYKHLHQNQRLVSPRPSIVLNKDGLAKRYAEFLKREQSR